MEASGEEHFSKRLEEFPCTFNLVNADKITLTRLKKIYNNSFDNPEDFGAEEIEKNNLLTWIYFSLANYNKVVGLNNKAIEWSNKAVQLSKQTVELGNGNNITSLGNQAYIMWRKGDETLARKCLERLKTLKADENFPKLLTEAKAEQAYSYGMLGGPKHLRQAINVYSDVVRDVPNNYKWKYGLGLAYQRASDTNILYLNTEKFDFEVCRKKAIAYFFEIAEKTDDDLQSKAFSHLLFLRKKHPPGLNPEYDKLFRHLDVSQLCDKALEKGSDAVNVLTSCGVVMSEIDLEKSIQLLEKSVAIKEKSNNYHCLGKIYFSKAKLLGWRRTRERPRRWPEHERDELFRKAVHCFKKAIIKWEGNVQAILELGILFRKNGQIEEALSNFDKLTKSRPSTPKENVNIITAHEHAGLCYSLMSKLGKKKLTIAVSLAADLAREMPEIKESAQDIWDALRGLGNNSATQLKKKITLLYLADVYDNRVDVLQKLRENRGEDMNNPELILETVRRYITRNRPEKALAFLNLATLNPAITEDTWKASQWLQQRVKVLLQAISGRLRDPTENATVLFQQLFLLCLGACVGLNSDESHGNTDLPEGVVGDLLVLYDVDIDSADDQSPTMKTARCLKEVATCLFGLDVEENVKGWKDPSECMPEEKLNEMRKYQVVIIVLGSEDRLPAAFNFHEETSAELTNHKILVFDAGLRDGQVPLCLRQYECFKVGDIGGLGDIDHGPGGGRDGDDLVLSSTDIIHQGFHGDVDAILKLFCFIIGQQWPCL